MRNVKRIAVLIACFMLAGVFLFSISAGLTYGSTSQHRKTSLNASSESQSAFAPTTLADDWFYSFQTIDTIEYVTVLSKGNFNSDNLIDVVVAGCELTCTLKVLLQSVDGKLVDSGSTYQYRNGGSDHLVVADLNNDSLDDIALVQQFGVSESIKLFLQQSNGQFDPIVYPTGRRAEALVAGDFNNDGLTDLAASYFGSNVMGVILQDGAGNLLPAAEYATQARGFRDMAAGDFNNDGLTDIVQTHGGYGLRGPSVTLFHQNASGSFDAANDFEIDSAQNYLAESVTAGDINNDGLDDIMVQSTRGLSVFLQEAAIFPDLPSGILGATTHYAGYGNPADIVIGDVDLDGLSDVITVGDGFTDVATYLQQPGTNTLGGFDTYPIAYSGSFYNTSLDVGDFNNDGKLDVIAASRGRGVSILYHSDPDFDVGISPKMITTTYGTEQITFTMSISKLYNFTDTVSVSVLESPTDTTDNLQAGPHSVPSSIDFVLTIPAMLDSSSTPYQVEVMGTFNGVTRTAQAEFTILRKVFLPIIIRSYE